MAVGGVKLAVAPSQAERARRLLAEDRSHQLADIPEQGLPPAPEERCPVCGGDSVQEARTRRRASFPQWFQALFFFGLGGIAVGRSSRVARACRDSLSRTTRPPRARGDDAPFCGSSHGCRPEWNVF
jgi:hypothetical protein